jgi:hypothetical protein
MWSVPRGGLDSLGVPTGSINKYQRLLPGLSNVELRESAAPQDLKIAPAQAALAVLALRWTEIELRCFLRCF